MAFTRESQSLSFPIDGVTMEQTLSSSYDPFSGIHISGSVQSHIDGTHNPKPKNTKESLKDWDLDLRPSLGLFSFDDDNVFADNFPDIIPGDLFKQIPKTNLVQNGDCKQIEKIRSQDGDTIYAIKPRGGWRYMLSLIHI